MADFAGPGTNPTAMNPATAILYAPLVSVEIQDTTTSTQYEAQGVTLITIEAGKSGPKAHRTVGQLFPSEQVPFGVFAAVIGQGLGQRDQHIYLFGVTNAGLQLARVERESMKNHAAYRYFTPSTCNFTGNTPSPAATDTKDIYQPGSFSYGTVFYSPFLETYILVYFNQEADSTFYVRYLDLDTVLCPTQEWIQGGLQGEGIHAEHVEALFRYAWSHEQVLFASPPGSKGYNYAGFAHPEFFNKQYYARWMYSDHVIDSSMSSDWLGGSVIPETDAGGDGRHLLLSWTSQDEGADGKGQYRVKLAKVEFDIAPAQSSRTSTGAKSQVGTSPTSSVSSSDSPGRSSSLGHERICSTHVQRIVTVCLMLSFVGLWLSAYC